MLKFNLQTDLIVNVLGRVEAVLQSPSAMYKDMGEYLVSTNQNRFKTSTAPDGSKWQANSQTTYMNILGQGHTKKDGTLSKKGINRVMSKRPLVGQGILMQDIHYQVSGNLLLVGSNMEYAATHQFGATIKPKNKKMLSWKIGNVSVFAKKVVIPARPFLGISVADKTELTNIVENHILP